MAAPPSQPFSLDEKGMRTAREAREAARAAKNGSNYHARRTYSPPPDDFHGAEGDAPRSPISDIALQDAMLARAESQVSLSLLLCLRPLPVGVPLEPKRFPHGVSTYPPEHVRWALPIS